MEDKGKLFEVVISGVGGKFPKSENIEDLRINLNNKVNLVTENDCRWNKDEWPGVPAATGKISVAQKCDDTFLGINSRIVKAMDPLTRVLLERAYEAIIDAGLNPKHVYGSQTSVYTASCVSDSEAIGCDEKLTTPFWLLAHVRALLANRVSNILNLQGPSYTIDSSWIGGVQILKQAAEDVAKGRVQAALVGVTNIIWHPDMAKHWIGLEKLSSDGMCRSFDENASGYGRSEGVVVLLLQRSTEALRSYGSVVHADARVCMEKAVNFITPSEDSFREFFKSFYEDCKVSPSNVSYLEADGSACKYYEEKELNISSEIFCGSQRTSPLLVGSVKSNLGHTEGASSLVSVVKALIALDSGVIPPNINFQSPNMKIEALKKETMKVVTEPIKLEGPIVAITTLGMPSSIGHILLKQNPKTKVHSRLGPSKRLVVLSSRTEKGISEAIDRVKLFPRDDEYLGLVQNAFSENIHGHFHRGYAILDRETSPSFNLQECGEINRPVWFVFGGMGSQWPGMASDLMEIPCFADSVKRCDKYTRSLGFDIVDTITNPDPEILKKNAIVSFLSIATIHIAFVDLLANLGIHPDAMFGHSLGENGCAYADGCFNTYETLMAAYSRGKTSEILKPEKGLMAAVGLNYQNIPDLPSSIDIGCHNSEDNVTLSGPVNDMENYMEVLKKRNVFVRAVNSNGIAYHSRMVRKQAEFVQKFIEKAVPNPKRRSSKWISTSVVEENWDSDLAKWCSGEYHANNFKNTVYFAEACRKIPKNVIVIEIAPHGLFQGLLKSSLDSSCKIVSLAKRGSKSPLKYFLTTLGELYTSGLQFDLNEIYPQPEYPVSRGTPSLAPLVSWNHEETWPINTYYGASNLNYVQLCLQDKTSRHLLGHKVNDAVVVPFSCFITEVLRLFENKQSDLNKSHQTVFENVAVHTPLTVSAEESTGFYTQIQYGTGSFEVIGSQNVLVTGMIHMYENNHLISPEPPTDLEVNIENEWISDTEIYRTFSENNIYYSNPYCTVQKILIRDGGFLAHVLWKNDLNIDLNSMMQLRMYADLCSCNDIALLPSWFRSLVIDKDKIKNLAQGSHVYISFDTRTNVIRGPGIEIEILRTSSFPTICPPPINLNIQKVQFVDQSNPKTNNLTQFISLCLQLIKNTFQSQSKLKTKLKINDAKFVEPFRNIFKIQPFLKADVEENSNIQITDLVSNDVLLLVTDNLNENLNKDIKKSVGKVFILIKNCITIDDTYATIIQQEHNGFLYRLITRITKLPNRIMEVTTKNSLWKQYIEQEVKLLTINVLPIVLVKIHAGSTIKIIQEVENIKSINGFRYVILSEGSQIFDLTKTFFREQLFKGLRQNILKNNIWGSYNVLPCMDNFSEESDEKELQKYFKKDSEVTIKYTGSFKTNIPAEEICSQYSGVDKEGKNIMGILKHKTENKRFEIDDVLKWYVNSEWTLQEAAKIPLAYSMAYYCLVIKACIKSGNSILIHDGCTSDGQAFIRVALSFNCKIFVTTYNNDQSDFLKSLFPKLNSSNILNLNNGMFEIQLLSLTKGKGCNIVINAVPTEFLWASLRCVKKFGTFVHIGTQDVSVHTKIGMSMFLKNVAMYGVQDLLHLINSSVETKNHLKQLVENGIKNRIVSRLYEETSKSASTSIKKIVGNSEKDIVQIEPNNSDHDFIKKDKSYVIIGSTTNLWIKTINWLLQQDAKKLIFVINGTNSAMRRSQRTIFSQIQKYSDVSFIMTSVERFNTVKEGESLLREFTSYSKIEAIFCVEMSDSKLKNIDNACRNVLPDLKHFVCLQSDANIVCESRNNTNANCTNVQCDKSIRKPEIMLKCMTKLIESSDDSKPIAVVVSYSSTSDYEKFNSITEYLPKTVDDLLDLNVDLPEYPRFEQSISISLHSTDKNSLLPVFIIPGLGISRIQPLISKIMHPVFCAKFPSYVNSVDNAALSLLWPLRQIQPYGPYTVVGETWGGTIAVEFAKIIEGFGETVNLILLDGCPFDNEKRLQLLDKVDLEFFSENSEKKEEISSSKEVLMKQLSTLRDFIPNNTQLAANAIIARPSSSDILDSCINFEKIHCGKLKVHISNKTSYIEFINSLETATIINEHASFKW